MLSTYGLMIWKLMASLSLSLAFPFLITSWIWYDEVIRVRNSLPPPLSIIKYFIRVHQNMQDWLSNYILPLPMSIKRIRVCRSTCTPLVAAPIGRTKDAESKPIVSDDASWRIVVATPVSHPTGGGTWCECLCADWPHERDDGSAIGARNDPPPLAFRRVS